MLAEPLLPHPSRVGALKRRSVCIIASLVCLNCIAIGVLLITGLRFPRIVGLGILAYSFGLRHAVDADHVTPENSNSASPPSNRSTHPVAPPQIAAIDNVTRKLLRDEKPSLLVGFYFSLGHSSVVTAMTILAMVSSSYIQEHMEATSAIGAVVGTLLSAALLFLIGLINLISALDILRARRKRSPGSGSVQTESTHDAEKDSMTVPFDGSGGVQINGIVTRCCPAIFNAVDFEGKMYGVGFLFGLGFETSSEVALLALAATAPSTQTPTACALLLPALFAAGMSLIDTIDGVMMFWAYSWSASQPGGRECYNLFLTSVSSIIAIIIGIIEVLGCIQHELQLDGTFWEGIEAINDNFEYVGYSIIGFFAVSAAAAAAVWATRTHQGGEV